MDKAKKGIWAEIIDFSLDLGREDIAAFSCKNRSIKNVQLTLQLQDAYGMRYTFITNIPKMYQIMQWTSSVRLRNIKGKRVIPVFLDGKVIDVLEDKD